MPHFLPKEAPRQGRKAHRSEPYFALLMHYAVLYTRWSDPWILAKSNNDPVCSHLILSPSFKFNCQISLRTQRRLSDPIPLPSPEVEGTYPILLQVSSHKYHKKQVRFRCRHSGHSLLQYREISRSKHWNCALYCPCKRGSQSHHEFATYSLENIQAPGTPN